MKRTFFAAVCLVLAVLLTACSGTRPQNIRVEDSAGEAPAFIVLTRDSRWPENEYTQGLPVPPGTVVWTMEDTEHESFSILLDGAAKARFKEYYSRLLASGYYKVEKTPHKSGVSIGTVVSDGSRTVSFAHSGSALVMTVINRGTEGSGAGLLRLGALENVYVSAYSTYDETDGVRVVTELYVPAEQKARPGFSMVSGVVSVTVGDRTEEFYLGGSVDAEAVGLAVSSGLTGASGEKGTVTVAGTAYADNAAGGCGSFAISYEITIP